jgi:ribosomal-protein-alanine N-acetyltransferase
VTDWPDGLAVRSWTRADAESVSHWRHSGRWSVYDQHDIDGMTAAVGYRAIVAADDRRLIGFYCVGDEALVPGIDADDGVIDIGVGMAPDLVGSGHGNAFLQAVLGDLGDRLQTKPVRAVIQSWNVRSLALARRLGFVEIGTHRCVQEGGEIDYVIVVRAPSKQSLSGPTASSATSSSAGHSPDVSGALRLGDGTTTGRPSIR